MIHPNSRIQFISDNVGCGVFATAFIPKGTIVYVKDFMELSITPSQYEKLPHVLQEKVEKYSYIENQGNRIVSWDHGKYVNHCCDCNTISTGYGFEIAIRDIHPGEEITDEYGLFNVPANMPLQCAKPNCRMSLRMDDVDNYYQQWDDKVRSALVLLHEVDQPLLPLVDEDTYKRVLTFLNNPEEYESVRNLKMVSVNHL
jgi:uncharacterized protein